MKLMGGGIMIRKAIELIKAVKHIDLTNVSSITIDWKTLDTREDCDGIIHSLTEAYPVIVITMKK